MTPIAKNYHNGVTSLSYYDEKFDNNSNFFQRNTGNYKFLPNSAGYILRYLGKEGDREVEAGVFMGGLKETEHICQLTSGRLRQECLLEG